MAVLKNLAQERSELERLRAEVAALKTANERTLKLKVSEKGGLSVYGLGRFPVTLYREQWEKLLSVKDDILGFIESNASSLKVKE
jgi:hypothetical protein